MTRKKALAQRIRLEVDELEQTVDIITRHWQRFKTVTEDQDAFLNRVISFCRLPGTPGGI